MRRPTAATVFGCASVLLSYPDDGYMAELAAVADATRLLPRGRARAALETAAADLQQLDLLAAQTRYVETFDLHRRRCLHLTFYTHGDTRQRGLALTSLSDVYRSAGVRLRPGELPDFLPALLELAAVSAAGASALDMHRGSLEALKSELEEASSAYLPVVSAVTFALGPITSTARKALARWITEGPQTEEVGLEPFAPPEVLARGLTE